MALTLAVKKTLAIIGQGLYTPRDIQAILDVLSVPFQSDQHLKQNSKLICKELNNH